MAPMATISAMRTATGFRKVGAGAAEGAGRGRDGSAFASGGGAGAPVSTASGLTISRCGFPHLWQKREPGASCAPQLQNSSMDLFQCNLAQSNNGTARSTFVKTNS